MSTADELDKLRALHERGALNDAEYARAKAQLLLLGLPDTPLTHSAASLVAGGAAAVSSNPFDVVKTRLQNMAPGPDGRMPYTGFVNCFLTTARTEGVRALYKARAERALSARGNTRSDAARASHRAWWPPGRARHR